MSPLRMLLVAGLSIGVCSGCARLEKRFLGKRQQPAPAVSGVAAPSAAPTPAPRRVAESPKVPKGYVTMVVGGVAPTSRGSAVVLTDSKKRVGVPIFVGGTEALSIALRLNDQPYERPLTHDLLDDIMHELGGDVVAVRVDKLQDNVFHGSVLLRQGDKMLVIDSRPSDAIALALGASAPIHVSQRVVDRAGVSLDEIQLMEPEKPTTRPREKAEGVTL